MRRDSYYADSGWGPGLIGGNQQEQTFMYQTKAYSAASATSPLAPVKYRFSIDMASLKSESDQRGVVAGSVGDLLL